MTKSANKSILITAATALVFSFSVVNAEQSGTNDKGAQIKKSALPAQDEVIKGWEHSKSPIEKDYKHNPRLPRTIQEGASPMQPEVLESGELDSQRETIDGEEKPN